MPRHNRRGSVYILVLGVTTLVMTISVGAALMTRSELQSQKDTGELLGADAAARSGLELTLATLNNAPTQIASLTERQLNLPTSIGGFVVAIAVTDPDDGIMGNATNERLKLIAMAERGDIRQYRSIIVEPVIDSAAKSVKYQIIPGTYQIEIE
jgi:hypothetical protein